MKKEIIMSLSWLALDLGFLLYILTQTNLSLKTIAKQFLIGFLIANIIFYAIFAVSLHNAGKDIKLLLNLYFFIIFIPFSSALSLMVIIATIIIANFFQKFYTKR